MFRSSFDQVRILETPPNYYIAGLDFIELEEEVRFFAASSVTRKCVNITILDDNIEEGDREETISVQVVSTDPPSLGIFPVASILSVSIMDSDSELHET